MGSSASELEVAPALRPGPAGLLGSPPLIGLSTYAERASFGVWDTPVALLPQAYLDAVTRAGGCPVLLPPVPWTAETVLAAVDGLVLTGGPDLGPSHYGADRHPQTGPSRPERDAWEIELCRASLSADLPLLAICRGLQVLNVCAGGDLHQHLPDVVGHDGHRATPGQMSPVHITFTPDSRVAALMGSATVGQCHHHQAVDRLGQGLEAVGFADDGTVEAVERPGQSFAVAVQWHPEDDGSGDRLFAALVGAAAQRRSTRLGGTDDHLAGAGRP